MRMPGGASYSQVAEVPSRGRRHRLTRSAGGAPNRRADTPAGSALPGRAVVRAATTRLPPLQARSVSLPAAGGSVSGADPSTLIVSSGAATASRSPPGSAIAVPPPASSSCQSGQLRTSQRPGCCSTRRSAPQNRSERLPAMATVGSKDAHQLGGTGCGSIVNPSSAQSICTFVPRCGWMASRRRIYVAAGVLPGCSGRPGCSRLTGSVRLRGHADANLPPCAARRVPG
jgi:hypothetical protein